MPGSGISNSRPPRASILPTVNKPILPRPPKTIKKIAIKADLPKQWRHISVVALAILVAGIGVDGRPVTGTNQAEPNQLASATRLGTARASDMVTSLLPTVKSIQLPPIPIKKAGVREPAAMASSVILIDDATKLPLYSKSVDVKRSVASTTKILTAQVALEHYRDLDRLVTITPSAANQIGSLVGYRAGETATIRQLLYGLMMVSGNDAAKMLSELYLPEGGEVSTTAFVAEMNRFAARLGMASSQFYDPAGLQDQGYSTASDMAKAMSSLLKQPTLTQIIETADYEYKSRENYIHTFKNSNRLVTDEMNYPGILGGKTGFTPETAEGGAGHCLIASAERNGHRLIVVVLGTFSNTPQASAEVARAILDYGFTNFTWTPLAR